MILCWAILLFTSANELMILELARSSMVPLISSPALLAHLHNRPSLLHQPPHTIHLIPHSFRFARFVIHCKNRPSDTSSEQKSTRQRSRKQQLKRQALAVYRSRFTNALRAELAQEMQEMKERLRHWPKQKLEAEGVALFDLSVRFEGRLYRDTVLRFYKSHGDGILPPHTQFSQGDIVVISRNHPLDEEQNAVEGVVMERARRFITVAVSPNQSRFLALNTKWRLDLSANRVAYERCLFAVDVFSSPLIQQQGAVCHLPTVDGLNGANFGWSSEGSIFLGEGATAIRQLILKFEEDKMEQVSEQVEEQTIQAENATEFHASQLIKSSEEVKTAERPPSQIGGKGLGAIKGAVRTYLQGLGGSLNTSQKSAIETAACQKVTLWQGPPGTGKTKTLTHFIFALRKFRGKVMACADSNVAVDNLVEGLLELGLKVARLGQPVKALNMKKTAAEKRMRSRQVNNDKRRAISAKDAKSMWDEAEKMEARALKDVLDRADVVAATCVGAGDLASMNCSFSTCVVDEATQATEPASLVPILRSGADCIVLVGDPKQLPPTVLSSTALEERLDISLFQHLQECGLRPCFLDTQYRMHPAIAALPSALFYSGRLKSHPLPSDRLAPNGYPWLDKERPIVFIDCVDGKEEATSENSSWFNRIEAAQVVKVLRLLNAHNDISGGCQGIGVITPYSAQVRLLQDMIQFGHNNGGKIFDGVEVKTVDGFQGREKEVIVFCTVRSNRRGQLGFVIDPRRMNVALTRAKCGLVVIGNSKTLECDKIWSTWLSEMKKDHLYLVKKSPDQP